jgi:Tol biopolymer transport system component
MGFALAAALAMIHFREVPEKRSATRFEFGLPQGVQATPSGGFSVSPDGDVLFAASDDKGSHWYLRRMDSTEVRRLDFPAGGDPMPASFSPDGRSIVYNFGKGANTANLDTGQAKTLCADCTALGAAWAKDGTILLGNVSDIARISQDGGALTPIVKAPKGDAAAWPVWLPDGKHFLYTMTAGNAGVGLRVGSVDTKPEDQSKTWLVERAFNAAWVPPAPGQPGYLLYTTLEPRDLVARPFDADKLEFLGGPIQVATALPLRQNWLWTPFAASSKGHVVYHQDGGRQQRPIWFDRTGKELGGAGDPAIFQTVVMSPDGKHAAFALAENNTQDIWIADLVSGTRTRLTTEPVPDTQPVWSHDGESVFYDSIRDNRPTIVRRASNGAPGEQIIRSFPPGTAATNLSDASPDGKLLVYHQNSNKGSDLWTLDITKPDADPQPLLQTEFQEIAARFSPDGKWFIYRSNESGRNEIYVQAVPGYGAPAGKWLISHDGSLGMARWRKDGREVYFLAPSGAIMAADVTTAPTFKSGPPHKLYEVPSAFRALFVRNPGTMVDITPDGQRFLFAVPLQDAGAVPFEVSTDFRAGIAK